ncbi:MAG TPA: alpha/beta hydrolase [Casimicrobiaceae bacterium]|nr:alpha/beta hydrolase [Casimicrobiaceae bacterium]
MPHLTSTLPRASASASSTVTAPEPDDRMTLLYATTRDPRGDAGERSYNASLGDGLRLGVATLRVDDAGAGVREERTLPLLSGAWDRPTARLQNLSEQAVFRTGADIDVLSKDTARFFSAIDRALSAAPDKDVFIYVHGGMNSVYRTAADAAQYRELTERNSVVVAFVWPTTEYFPNYLIDMSNARQSAAAFSHFIELLARHTHAEHINILAHSLGSRIVSLALASLGTSAKGVQRDELRDRLRLGEVYYAAADIEIKDFVSQLKHYADLPLRTTLQANRDDGILALLGAFPGSSRAGRLNVDELNDSDREALKYWANGSRLDIVDVTSERGGNLMARGHALWYERRWVSSDVLLEFMYHVPPQMRGLEASDSDGLRRWMFPSDYEKRVAAALQRLSRL